MYVIIGGVETVFVNKVFASHREKYRDWHSSRSHICLLSEEEMVHFKICPLMNAPYYVITNYQLLIPCKSAAYTCYICKEENTNQMEKTTLLRP